jgi:hypothetical protein
MEDDGTFYGHFVHFTVFCYILWTFGIVRGYYVCFFRFGILYQEKSGNPVYRCRNRVDHHQQFQQNVQGIQHIIQHSLPFSCFLTFGHTRKV